MAKHQGIIWDHCYWHPELRCVYIWVPKAASTSVKRWLVNSTERWGPMQRSVHEQLKVAALGKLPRAEAESILHSPDVFKFAFVRNPYTRLVSAYVSIMVAGKVSVERLVRHHAQQTWEGSLRWAIARFSQGVSAVCQDGLSFRELVYQMEREAPASLDPHFRSQSQLLLDAPLDFIGRMETLEDDFRYVRERLGARGDLEFAYRHEYEEEADDDFVADWPVARFRGLKTMPHWRRFYPPDLKRRVARLYAQDFERLGYPVSEGALLKAA